MHVLAERSGSASDCCSSVQCSTPTEDHEVDVKASIDLYATLKVLAALPTYELGRHGIPHLHNFRCIKAGASA